MFYYDDGDCYFETIEEACEHFCDEPEKAPEKLELCHRIEADSFLGDSYIDGLIERLITDIDEDVCELSDENFGFSERLSPEAEAELRTMLRRWLNVHYNGGRGIISPNGKTIPFKPILEDWIAKAEDEQEAKEDPGRIIPQAS